MYPCPLNAVPERTGLTYRISDTPTYIVSVDNKVIASFDDFLSMEQFVLTHRVKYRAATEIDAVFEAVDWEGVIGDTPDEATLTATWEPRNGWIY